MRKTVMFATLALLVLAGCATTGPTGYPRGANDLVAETYDMWEERDIPVVLANLRESAELFPNPLTWYQLARHQRDLGDERGAFESLNKAIELDPGFAAARYARGEMQMWGEQVNNYEAGIADIEEAWRLRPEQYRYGLTLAGELRWHKDRSAEANVIIDTIAANFAGDAWAMLAVMKYQTDTEQYDGARRTGSTLLGLLDEFDDPYLQGELARNLYLAKMTSEAKMLLSSFLEWGIDDPWFLNYIGKAMLERTSEFADARAVYANVLQSEYAPDGEMLLFAALAEYLGGNSGQAGRLFDRFLQEGGSGDPVHDRVAHFALALIRGGDAAAAYQALVLASAEFWGRIDDKRTYYFWLDELLKKGGR